MIKPTNETKSYVIKMKSRNICIKVIFLFDFDGKLILIHIFRQLIKYLN